MSEQVVVSDWRSRAVVIVWGIFYSCLIAGVIYGVHGLLTMPGVSAVEVNLTGINETNSSLVHNNVSYVLNSSGWVPVLSDENDSNLSDWLPYVKPASNFSLSSYRYLKKNTLRSVNYDFRSNDWLANESVILDESWAGKFVPAKISLEEHDLLVNNLKGQDLNQVRFNHSAWYVSQYRSRVNANVVKWQGAMNGLSDKNLQYHIDVRSDSYSSVNSKDVCGYCGSEQRTGRLV